MGKLFQFHNGSIKTSKRILNQVIHARFNSTMVQLKQVELINDEKPGYWFQFHNGSIKTPPTR